jgi:hypothetical protein
MTDLGRYLSRQQPQPPAGGLSLQRATVITWNAGDGFVISLAGTPLSGVPVLASAGELAPGQQVAVLRQKTSALIIGVIVAPS